MLMDKKIKSRRRKVKFREEIKIDPRGHRIYGPGHTYWTGSLRDGRDRGPYPYYCPVGWERYAFHVNDNYDEKFKGWSISYHGTKFTYGLSILLSGLAPARLDEHGPGIYTTPSIIYAAHPRYAEIKRIESSDEKNLYKIGQYVQYVLECRVHPNKTKVGPETLLVRGKATIDPNFSNNVIEWATKTQGNDIVNFNDPNSTVVCTGLMVRVTDNHPGLLRESQWWYSGHLCGDKTCCFLGVDYNELMKQKFKGYGMIYTNKLNEGIST
ncbi:unnamed protein product [Rotaria sordida]|uniref:Uncharacterized protein n=1 Tax=Rotaria sordida TaxID=392033 RepID=A0A819P0A0_9BILA|nr:unnamed protein product [Rotaria sordida]